MRIDVKDFEQKFRSEGSAFEGIIHDLVRAVGRTVGIGSHQIRWDYRTNVKDGGRDLVVDIGNPTGSFIPPVPSIWSFKSGDDGVKPNKLRNEILAKNHPKIRIGLKAGHAYVWVTAHPARLDVQDTMKAEAALVAAELGVNPALIEFRWQEGITDEVNNYPNLIAVHLSEVASQWAGLITLREWKREPELKTEWADFGGREDVVARVAEHLLGRSGQNVLHIAGLSGIGKTRTVLEACLRNDELNGVFYLDRYASLTREFWLITESCG